MLCENSDRQMSLICITGYKAGIDPYVNIPAEACVREDGLGISASWLWDNFEHWIFPDVDKEIILVKEHPLEVEEIYA